jgi:hypothetical protein
LPECIFKYIINTGIINDRYRKVDDLVLLFPGDSEEVVLSNPNYSPKIILIPSKPGQENYLKSYILSLIKTFLPQSLIS